MSDEHHEPPRAEPSRASEPRTPTGPGGDPARVKRALYLAGFALSFVTGVLLQVLYPGVESVTPIDFGIAFGFSFLAFAWMRVDARQNAHRAGKAIGLFVLLLPIFGMPTYLVRARGWRRGSLATAAFLGLLVGSIVPTFAGMTLAYWLAPGAALG